MSSNIYTSAGLKKQVISSALKGKANSALMRAPVTRSYVLKQLQGACKLHKSQTFIKA